MSMKERRHESGAEKRRKKKEATVKLQEEIKRTPSLFQLGFTRSSAEDQACGSTAAGSASDVMATDKIPASQSYKLICDNMIQSTFPNVLTALRIYRCLMITNANDRRTNIFQIENSEKLSSSFNDARTIEYTCHYGH